MVPGIVARHAVITDECRQNRGDEGAFDEAVARLRDEYAATLKGWAGTSGLRLHVVLAVEPPHRTEEQP